MTASNCSNSYALLRSCYPDLVDDHRCRERGGVRIAGPVAADGDVEDDEHRLGQRSPVSSEELAAIASGVEWPHLSAAGVPANEGLRYDG